MPDSKSNTPSVRQSATTRASRRLPADEAIAGIKALVERGRPDEAWEFALAGKQWLLWADALAPGRGLVPSNQLSLAKGAAAGDQASPHSGEPERWRRAGALAGARYKEFFGDGSQAQMSLLSSESPELLAGALTELSEAGWMGLAKGLAAERGFDQRLAKKLAGLMRACSPDFQRELMELDWAGSRSLLMNDGSGSVLPGIRPLASLPDSELLSRAVGFLKEKGVSLSDQLTALEMNGRKTQSALSFAVVARAEACARLILNECPGASAVLAVREAHREWSNLWGAIMGEDLVPSIMAGHVAFAEKMDLESSVSVFPAARQRRGI